MTRLTPLLDKLQRLTAQQAATEAEIRETRRRIEAGAREPSERPKARSKRRPNSYGTPEGVQAVVKVLKDAGKPMARVEIAQALGKDGNATGYQLKQAMQRGFVERTSYGKYRLTDATNAAI